MKRIREHTGSSEDGASTVEFALIVPIFLALVFAIFQFAIAFGNYLAVTHAAREGARLAAVGRYSETVVRERAYPVTPNSVTVNYPQGQAHGMPVEVRVEHRVRITIPFFGTREIPLVGRARMRQEV